MRPLRFVLLTVSILGMSAFFYSCKQKPQACADNICVDVEVVSKSIDLQRGLQGHSPLSEKEGMLFIFEKDSKHAFWMKKMHFNIDMIWIDQRGKIVHIEENVPPCKEDPCPTYTPTEESRYVLEVKSGMSRRNGWNKGDTFFLKI